MLTAMQPHEVEWIKVKGHADNERNNRVDQLAVEASKKFQ
jgi:ribonuclease HI